MFHGRNTDSDGLYYGRQIRPVVWALHDVTIQDREGQGATGAGT